MIKQIYYLYEKDLPMSAGKLAAQVSHGSLSFFSWMLFRHLRKTEDGYAIENMKIDKDLWDGWLDPEHASFTKIVLAVKIKISLKNNRKGNNGWFCGKQRFFLYS